MQGWSKSNEAGDNKNQGPRHPQKWDPQGVDKHNVLFQHLVPRVSQQRYILEYVPLRERLVGIPPLHESNEVLKKLGTSKFWPALVREWP